MRQGLKPCQGWGGPRSHFTPRTGDIALPAMRAHESPEQLFSPHGHLATYMASEQGKHTESRGGD